MIEKLVLILLYGLVAFTGAGAVLGFAAGVVRRANVFISFLTAGAAAICGAAFYVTGIVALCVFEIWPRMKWFLRMITQPFVTG